MRHLTLGGTSPAPGGLLQYFRDLFRRIGRFLLVFVGVYVVAAVLFFLLEGGQVTLFNSFYWSIVTLGTVGYGDVVPTTAAAKVLATGVIATQVFLLAYLITVITTAVNEQAQNRALGTYGTRMSGHIVVAGYSAVGRAAVRELLAQEQKVAVVTDRAEDVPNIRTLAGDDRLFVTYGSPADLDILRRANAEHAHSVIVCTPDDATNMIAALNLKSVANGVRIVVSVSRPELRDTLRAAGVTYVASPADMGGRLCASAAFEPDVAHALEDMSAADVQSDIQEYLVGPTTPFVGKTFEEADALTRKNSGGLLIGYAHPDGQGDYRTVVNPPFDTRLVAGDAVILVATIPNAQRFRAWFGTDQGR